MTANDDALFPASIAAAADARGQRASVEAVERVLGPGKVYQGVSKSIRVLTAGGRYSDRDPKIDPDEYAGLIALARSTARVVDRMSGHNVSGWTSNGRDLAPLVEQLREVMSALHGDTDSADPLLAWLADDEAPIEHVDR